MGENFLQCVYILWQTSRAPISVALATEEEHLHTITAGWSAPAEAHQARASKAASARARGRDVSSRKETNSVLFSPPDSSAWPTSPPFEARRTEHGAQQTEERGGSLSTALEHETSWHFTLLTCTISNKLHPPGSLLHLTLSCDSSARHTGGECGQVTEESLTTLKHEKVIKFPPRFFFLFSFPLYFQAALPPQPWKTCWNTSPKSASASSKSWNIWPLDKAKRSGRSPLSAWPLPRGFRCQILARRPPNSCQRWRPTTTRKITWGCLRPSRYGRLASGRVGTDPGSIIDGRAAASLLLTPPHLADAYEELKREILGRVGLSPVAAPPNYSIIGNIPARSRLVPKPPSSFASPNIGSLSGIPPPLRWLNASSWTVFSARFPANFDRQPACGTRSPPGSWLKPSSWRRRRCVGRLGSDRRPWPGGCTRSDARRRAPRAQSAGQRFPAPTMSPCPRSHLARPHAPGWQVASSIRNYHRRACRPRSRWMDVLTGPSSTQAALSAWSNRPSFPRTSGPDRAFPSPAFMATPGRFQRGGSTSLPAPAPGPLKWASSRTSRYRYCSDETGRGLTSCTPLFANLPALPGTAGKGEPAVVPTDALLCWQPTAPETVSPPPNLLTFSSMCSNRLREGDRSQRNNSGTTG